MGDLQVLRQQEKRPKEAEVHEQRDEVDRGKPSAPEEAERQHRRPRVTLPEHEHPRQQGSGEERREHLPGRPADLAAPDDPEDKAEQARAGQDDADRVEARVRAVALP